MDSELDHIEGFVRSFIRREFRARWLHVLLEKPCKAEKELRRFEHHLDERHCRLVDNADAVLEEVPGLTEGLYFDGTGSPRFTSLKEALDEASVRAVDSLFSIVPGRQAVFIFHEGWAWLCQESKPNPR